MKRFNFPFDYKPKLDLKNTIVYSSILKQLIFNYFQNKYRAIILDPALLVCAKNSVGSHVNGDRVVNFDNKSTNTITGLNNNQENYLTLSSIALKNQNILSYCPFIRRDANQTNTQSVFNWNINLDLAMPKDSLNIDFFCQYMKTLFGEIIDITKLSQLKKIYSPSTKKTKVYEFNVINLQKIEDKYPTLSLKKAIAHYVSKHNFTIITQNFNRTNRNNWLETPVLTAVDLEVCCGLYVYDEFNDEAINLINIIKRPNGKKSHDQLNDFNPIELTNELYDKKLFDDKRPTNMGISINFTNLVFYLLDKVHLAEVVASIWPNDFIEFIKKAKIEIF